MKKKLLITQHTQDIVHGLKKESTDVTLSLSFDVTSIDDDDAEEEGIK